MRRAVIFPLLTLAVLCATAVRSVVIGFRDRLTGAIDFAIRFVFAASPEPTLAFVGAGGPLLRPSPCTFSDPQVERHEAGQSRRAAARGI
jgi:hypothetical protein